MPSKPPPLQPLLTMDPYKDPVFMAAFSKEFTRLAAAGLLHEPVAARPAPQSSIVVPRPTAPIAQVPRPMEHSSPESEAMAAAAKAIASYQLLTGMVSSSIPSLPRPPPQYRLGARGPVLGGSLRTTSHSGIFMALESPVSVAAIPPVSLPISGTTVTPVVPLPQPPLPLARKTKAVAPKTKAPPKKRGRKPAQATAVATSQAIAQVLTDQEAPSGPTNIEVDLSGSEPEHASDGEEELAEIVDDGVLTWEPVQLSKWLRPAGCARWDIGEGKEGDVGGG